MYCDSEPHHAIGSGHSRPRSINILKWLETLNASLIVKDAGMIHLAELTSLRKLGLYSNPEITDAGVVHLRNLTSLETLQLQFTKISDRGLGHLEGLESLRFLDLRGTQVTPEELEVFRARHPSCRVLH